MLFRDRAHAQSAWLVICTTSSESNFFTLVVSSSIFTLPSSFVLTMTTAGSDMTTDAGESSSSSSAAPSTISKDVLKEALKEVLTENPSLLTAARR